MSVLFELFIDELGNVSVFDKKSKIYVLCGCAVSEKERADLKIASDQVKFKYWGRTDIVFHSRDIGLRGGDFAIFRNNEEKWNEFKSDLLSFLKKGKYTIFVIVCDKRIARRRGWNSVKLIRETAKKLFYHYLSWLLGLKRGGGRITVESATAEKDRYYLNEFSYFLSPGCRELNVNFSIVRSILTSISFVTKNNADIEEQIADLFAYSARCLYLRKTGKEFYGAGSYESEMMGILEKKIFKKPKFARGTKMKFYEVIEPFCVLPRVTKVKKRA